VSRPFPFLLLAAAALTAAVPATAQPVRTVLVSATDYPDEVRPSAALFNLAVRYELGADGSVARCTVTQSSGQPSIDAASCRILGERARFRPEPAAMRGALRLAWLGGQSLANGNARGAPIPFSLADVMSSDDYPMEAIRRGQRGIVGYEADVSENGVPLRCRVIESSGSIILDRFTCDMVIERGAFIAASDGAGGRRAGVYRGRMRWRP